MSEEPEKPEVGEAEASEEAPVSEAPARASETDIPPEASGIEGSEPVSESQPPAEEEAAAATQVAEKPKRGVRGRRSRAGGEADAETAETAETAEKPEKPEKPAKPAVAPRRRRVAREPGAPAPVVRAQAKYVRSSARKARLVCDNIRGKTVAEARAILAHTPRAVAKDWSKLLESAVANAEHNHELVGEDLYVKAITADEGPTIKRFRPRAMGRATKIRKRTAHLTILLTPKD
jgi:ribosomal protein L22